MQIQGIDALIRQLQSPAGIAVTVAALLVVLIAVLVVINRRKTADMRLLKKTITKHSEAVERDAVISDGLDGFLFVDYLLLLRGKIVAMKVLSKRGYIFGDEKIDEWTCVENNRTEKFSNPLADVRLCAQQLRHALEFDAVEPSVLFGRQSEFPKGVPEGVLRLAHLDEKLDALKGSEDTDEVARQAWAQLIAMVHKDRQALGEIIRPDPD